MWEHALREIRRACWQQQRRDADARALARLPQMSTARLLALRDKCYRVNGGTIPADRQDDYGVYVYDGAPGGMVSLAQIKAELAKREHVPNKLERQATRRAKAQRSRSRGRRDR